jgi:PilZ domain-containing protein
VRRAGLSDYLPGRVRAWFNDRRRDPRYKARLPLSVSLAGRRPGRGTSPPTVIGYTHDVSASGLGLILPSLRVGDHDLAEGGHPLNLTLELGRGRIQAQAAAVHSLPLGPGPRAGESDYLVGAHLTGISDGDRALLVNYTKRYRFPVSNSAPE